MGRLYLTNLDGTCTDFDTNKTMLIDECGFAPCGGISPFVVFTKLDAMCLDHIAREYDEERHYNDVGRYDGRWRADYVVIYNSQRLTLLRFLLELMKNGETFTNNRVYIPVSFNTLRVIEFDSEMVTFLTKVMTLIRQEEMKC